MLSIDIAHYTYRSHFDAIRAVAWHPKGTYNASASEDQTVQVREILTGRPKDRNDTQALCQRLKVRTRRQAQQLVDRYIPNKQLQQLNNLDDTLNDVFP